MNNDFVLQRLLDKNKKLKQELESSKSAIKVSEACKTIQEYVSKKNSEPFDPKNFTDPNPFQEPTGCLCFSK